jgi:Amt family ammonium transporter
MAFIMHVIGLFILVAASEMLNGIARTVLLNKRVGVTKAKRIALLPALALCLLICYYYVPFLNVRTDLGLLINRVVRTACNGCGGDGWCKRRLGITTGIFTQRSINSFARWDGLFYGETHLLMAQLISIGVTILIATGGTLFCTAVVKSFVPLRVSETDEKVGLDISQHGENAYPAFNGLD